MNQNAKLDALENLLVSSENSDAANKAVKKIELAMERNEALETPSVGDDLSAYRKSGTEERERQFIATLKIVQALRQQQSDFNEKIADVECLFGDAVFLTFDYLALLYNRAHPVQLEKVQEIAIASWMKIAARFDSKELAKAFLDYLKSLLHVTDQLLEGLEAEGVIVDADLLMSVVTDKGVAKTEEGREAIRRWEESNAEHGGADWEKHQKVFREFIDDLEDVCEKSTAVAIVFTELAPSIALDKAKAAMKMAAYHALCQVIYLHAALINVYQMEFYANQLQKEKSRKKSQKFIEKIEELEQETAQNEVAARETRQKAANHLKNIGLSVARKSQLNTTN